MDVIKKTATRYKKKSLQTILKNRSAEINVLAPLEST